MCFSFVEKASTQESSKSLFCRFFYLYLQLHKIKCNLSTCCIQLHTLSFFTDHFSGPDRAVGPVCVYVCVSETVPAYNTDRACGKLALQIDE